MIIEQFCLYWQIVGDQNHGTSTCKINGRFREINSEIEDSEAVKLAKCPQLIKGDMILISRKKNLSNARKIIYSPITTPITMLIDLRTYKIENTDHYLRNP